MIDDLVSRGAEQATPDGRVTAVADHHQVSSDLKRVVGQDLRRVSRADFTVRHQAGFVDARCRFPLRFVKEALCSTLFAVDLIHRRGKPMELPAMIPVAISTSATETPVRIDRILATKASSIHAEATNQMLPTCSIKLPPAHHSARPAVIPAMAAPMPTSKLPKALVAASCQLPFSIRRKVS